MSDHPSNARKLFGNIAPALADYTDCVKAFIQGFAEFPIEHTAGLGSVSA